MPRSFSGIERWTVASTGAGAVLTLALLLWRPAAGLAGWLAAAWGLAAALGCAGLARSRGQQAAELEARLSEANDRSRVRRTFRYGEELYRDLFDHNPAAVYRSTVDGILLDCNEAMVRLFGYPDRASFLAQPVSELFWDPEDRRPLLELLFKEGAIRNVEVRFRKRNGELFWGLKNEGLLRCPTQGLPTAIEGTLLDITERKRAEEALAAERRLAEEALRQSEASVRSLHEIAGAQDLTFREKIRSLLALGCDAFGMELAALFQVEGGACVIVEAKTPGNVVLRGTRAEMHETYYPAVLASGRPLAFTRAEDAPEAYGCRVLPVESCIGGLVLVEGHPWGLLNFASQRPRPVPFRTSDLDLLELMVLWLGRELERDQRDGEMALVREMGDLFQSCKSTTEACQVISRQAVRLFPGMSGVVYRVDPDHHELHALVAWGQAEGRDDLLPMASCWACRREEEHYVPDPSTGLLCGHLPGLPPSSSLCVPMRAHGESGVLHLRLDPGADGAGLNERRRRLAGIVAKHLAMALSNLGLLERLHEQSIRDPLTRLYNRRHFEKTLRDEVRRADRSGRPLALLMIDVDHFKRINDTFAHEGGDAVLRSLGGTLLRNCRGEDVPCRLGGEELALLLPSASLESACQRAEELRAEVHALRVAHAGRTIQSLTISVGVAVYPDHGDEKEVLRLADRAMYLSKETGRDRVSVAPLPLRRRKGEEEASPLRVAV